MTGPEHYRAAERLLDPKGPLYVAVPEDIPVLIAGAQVHATLALAAATELMAIPPKRIINVAHGGAEVTDR